MLCPQCPAGFVWNNIVRELKSLIDHVAADFEIKSDRIVISGSSMGGYGAWEMALTYRNFFAAAAPVAGGGMPWRTPGLISTPIFAYSGETDELVDIECSKQMVEGVLKSGGRASLTLFPGLGHNEGINYAYAKTRLIEELLQCRRTDFTYIPDSCEYLFLK